MNSETTILFLIATLSTLYFALITISQIIFAQVDTYNDAIKDPRTRLILTKIEQLTQNIALFNTIVSTARLFTGAMVTLSLYHLITPMISFSLWQETLIIVIATTATLGIIVQVLARSLALIHGERLIFISLVTYQFTKIILFPIMIMAYLIHGLQALLLKIAGYDERYTFLSNEEKERLMASGDEEGLDREEREMIRNIFEFGETTVKEIMVPRVDLEALPIEASYQDVITFINEAGHSRIPIYEDNIDSIIGILYVKEIIRWLSEQDLENAEARWQLRDLINKPYFVPANKMLDDLMTEMKKNHFHLVVVVDEYGGTEGIVTMEDLLEEIVGEIHDEYDEVENPIVKLSPRTYLVDPHIELDDLAEIIPLPFQYENKEYNTLGGLFYHEYGDVPEPNTSFTFGGLELRIRKMDNQKIEEIIVQLPEGIDTSEVDNAF